MIRGDQTIAEEQLSPRKLIKRANVELLEQLTIHLIRSNGIKRLQKIRLSDTVVAPTFRP